MPVSKIVTENVNKGKENTLTQINKKNDTYYEEGWYEKNSYARNNYSYCF